jgi:hypothetical protein
VKQNSRAKLLVLLAGVICLGVLVFAGLKAGHYNSPHKPAISQKSVEGKLTNPQQPTPSKAKNTNPSPTTNVPSASTLVTPSPKLSNTGPGNILELFILSAVLGYAFHILMTARLAKLRES